MRFAEEPELAMTAYFIPKWLANSSSNSLTVRPIVKESLLRTSMTASFSSSHHVLLARPNTLTLPLLLPVIWLVDDYLRAVELEPERDMEIALERILQPLPLLGLDIKQDKAAAPGAQELAAYCAVLYRRAVNVVYLPAAYLSRKAPLELPRGIKEPAEARKVPVF